jgi:DNA repair exonuclease SbcCD ATPase subunit
LGTVEPLNAGQIVALRAEAERLRQDAARHEEEEAANCPEDRSCIETIKALRAEVETFRKDAQFWKNQVKDLEGDRADLAAAREEIAKLLNHNEWLAKTNAEIGAARERAEERVKGLEETDRAENDRMRAKIKSLENIIRAMDSAKYTD